MWGKKKREPSGPTSVTQMVGAVGLEPMWGKKNREPSGPASVTQMVGAVGFEPTSLPARVFKTPAYANSATPPGYVP